jgi:CheY-specific phosphatase CheX
VETEHIAVVLGDAAQNVLETMFFMMAEGDAEASFPPDIELLRTSMTFTGEWSGTFELQTPVACARAIAESFAGADDAEEVGEVMCELTNMVCGSTLSQLAGDKIFDLSAPRLEPAANIPANAVTASRALNFGDGIVAFALAIEANP